MRKDAKFKSTNYLCALCGFARKFFATTCKEFILNRLKAGVPIIDFVGLLVYLVSYRITR
jgi:hypothetical protein